MREVKAYIAGAEGMKQYIVKYLRQPSMSSLVDMLLRGLTEEEITTYIGVIELDFKIWQGTQGVNTGIWLKSGVEVVDRIELESIIVSYPFIVSKFSITVLHKLKGVKIRNREVRDLVTDAYDRYHLSRINNIIKR